jgi:hypothetical protein
MYIISVCAIVLITLSSLLLLLCLKTSKKRVIETLGINNSYSAQSKQQGQKKQFVGTEVCLEEICGLYL